MADICVPPDCLNGYDCYWLFFFVYVQAYLTQMHSMQNLMKTHKEPLRPSAPLTAICCGIAVVYTVIQLLLLYISLYLYYIWYRFSCLSKSILSFKEMAKLVITVVSTVIYSYSCYIYCYISLYYLTYIIIETLFTPPINSITFSCNSVISCTTKQQGI